jgi:hypothetical protein
MRLDSYGPGRFRTKAQSTNAAPVKSTQQLLGSWGRRNLALNAPNRILAAEETTRVDDCREPAGAVAVG